MPAVSQFTPIDAIVIRFDPIQARLDLLDEETRLDVVNGAIFVYERFAEAIDRLCDHRGQARLTLAGWSVYGPVTYSFEFALDAMIIVDFSFGLPPDIDPDGTGNVGFFILELGARKRAKRVRPSVAPQRRLMLHPAADTADGNAVRPILAEIAAQMARPRSVADTGALAAPRAPSAIQRALVRTALAKAEIAARRNRPVPRLAEPRRGHPRGGGGEQLIMAVQAALLPTQLAELAGAGQVRAKRRKRDALMIREVALALAERYAVVARLQAMRGADLVNDGIDLAAFIAMLAGESVCNTRRAALAVQRHARRPRRVRLAEQALAGWLFRADRGFALGASGHPGHQPEREMPQDTRLSAFFTAEAAAQWAALLDRGVDRVELEPK